MENILTPEQTKLLRTIDGKGFYESHDNTTFEEPILATLEELGLIESILGKQYSLTDTGKKYVEFVL